MAVKACISLMAYWIFLLHDYCHQNPLLVSHPVGLKTCQLHPDLLAGAMTSPFYWHSVECWLLPAG